MSTDVSTSKMREQANRYDELAAESSAEGLLFRADKFTRAAQRLDDRADYLEAHAAIVDAGVVDTRMEELVAIIDRIREYADGLRHSAQRLPCAHVARDLDNIIEEA